MNIKIFFFLVASLLLTYKVNATHLRGGEITVTRPECGSLEHSITITVYLDAESTVPFGGGVLDFGDGSNPITLPDVQSVPRPDLGRNISIATFQITHTYASAGSYVVTYTEPNRNANILNIPNSVNTRFSIETLIVIDPSVGCNSSPILLIPPVDRACGGVAWYHNPGAFDPDGDSLSYEIVVPRSAPGVIITGYEFPADPDLYADFSTGNETKDGPAYFNINPITGLITWNAPPIPQQAKPEGEGDEYSIAFIVREWRKLFGKWVPLGYVRRDMQIIVETCDNNKPELIVPEDICVEAGTLIDEEIFGIDPDKDSVKIEVFSQTMLFENSPSSYQPDTNPFQWISSEIQGQVNFTWQTTCDHVRDQSYQVVFKITDKPDGGPRLVNFATWNITVIGPSPEINDLAVENQGRSLRINWDEYLCENADLMQVWRKVDSNPYVPDSCETGIREEAGYRQIAEVPLDANSFLDNNLAMGAKYCYRLVAIFNDNIIAESKVSEEMCYEFVAAEAPIITHVSVEQTSHDDGEIRVSWKKPFDLDPSFIGDFQYDVYRARGMTGTTDITRVASLTNDTTFLDQGLNTEEQMYNYRIVLIVPDGPYGNNPVDTSAIASSVRLELQPEFDRLELTWEAEVPWSNVIAIGEGQYHYIYRGDDGATRLNQLTLIDSVKVAELSFNYIDSGQYLNTVLESDKFYCYGVITRGTYGNPSIQAPLNNFSQITCAQPIDTIPPCAPNFTLSGIDCETYAADYGCNYNAFENILEWARDPTFTCETDIREYEVYYAEVTNGEYELITTTRDTTYIHTGLASFKGCYKIRAIDRAGNVSEFSNEFCFDNCPNYELPNIITPNGDKCNDVFRAFHDPQNSVGEDGEIDWECGVIDLSRCKRFVKSVDFIVVNRWGKEVYSYNSEEYLEELRSNGESVTLAERDYSTNINWKGNSDDGTPLPPGIYYYLARVEFDVVDPGEAVKDIKGWVQILR